MDAAGDGDNQIQMAELGQLMRLDRENHPPNPGGGAVNGDPVHMSEPVQQQQGTPPANLPPNASPAAAAANQPPNAAAAGGAHAPGFDEGDPNTLLVVATLITALSYQVGTNIPGGYWGDDSNGHVAGDPIMRDKHRLRYWLFMVASWAGFGSSMLLTVALLTEVPIRSRVVKGAFLVAYSSLVLTFVTSQPRTSLAMDIAIWCGVMAAQAVVTSYLRIDLLPNWAQTVFLQVLRSPCRCRGNSVCV